MLVGASGWSDLFEAGSCELTFTLFDPVGWGLSRSEAGTSFSVGGTWDTWPVVEMTASAGSYVQVSLPFASKYVKVEQTFAGGEAVVIDCEAEAVTVDGVDARADVALGSDFFALEPGDVTLAFAGCSAHTVAFPERWA